MAHLWSPPVTGWTSSAPEQPDFPPALCVTVLGARAPSSLGPVFQLPFLSPAVGGKGIISEAETGRGLQACSEGPEQRVAGPGFQAGAGRPLSS